MYYPKSQIKSDLYTNGGEFVIASNQEDYEGHYFITSDEKYYTGRNPNDKPNNLLLPSTSPKPDPQREANPLIQRNESYYNYPLTYAQSSGRNISNNIAPPSNPTQTLVLPTEENYEIQEFQRYFLKKVNDIVYLEINKEEYDRYLNKNPLVNYQLYIPFTFPWLISGNRNEVINVNKKTIDRITQNLKLVGFPSYFSNRLDQYFRYQIGENLKTDGTEFIVESTRRPYIGLYHVHPNKGPMVGAQHVPFSHEFLIPISGSNQQNRVDRVETQTSNNRGSIGYGGGY